MKATVIEGDKTNWGIHSDAEYICIPRGVLPEQYRKMTPDEILFILCGSVSINDGYYVHEFDHDDKIISVSKQSMPTRASSELGAIGEEAVRSMLIEEYVVNTVAAEGHKGDLVINRAGDLSGAKIMVEVKNYKSTVSSKEIEKFHRDMNANATISAGIFVSIGSGKVSGINKAITLSSGNGDARPIMIVVSGDINVIRAAVSLLWANIDMLRVGRYDFKNKIGARVAKLNNMVDRISLCRVNVIEARSLINRQFDKIYESLVIAQTDMQKTIRGIHKLIDEGGADVGIGVDAGEDAEYSFTVEMLVSNEEAAMAIVNERLLECVSGSFYCTVSAYRQYVLDFIRQYFTSVCTDPAETINISTIKKNTLVMRAAGGFEIRATLFKVKIDIYFKPPPSAYVGDTGSEMYIPTAVAYDGEYMILTIDKNYTKSGIHDVLPGLFG